MSFEFARLVPWDSAPDEERPPDPDPSPYPSPQIGALLLDPGVDEYYERECYVWCHLVVGDADWELEVGGDEFLGTPPEWWERDIDAGNTGIGLDYLLIEKNGGEFPVMSWALREGLLPYQWFCVYLSETRWYRCSYEYNEWDFDCDFEIIRKENPDISLRELEEAIIGPYDFRKKVAQRREENLKARWAATNRMNLCWTVVHGRAQHWEEYPHGISVRLESTLSEVDTPEKHWWHPLADGRSETGKHEEALAVLASRVAAQRPDLTIEALSKLPSRWNR